MKKLLCLLMVALLTIIGPANAEENVPKFDDRAALRDFLNARPLDADISFLYAGADAPSADELLMMCDAAGCRTYMRSAGAATSYRMICKDYPGTRIAAAWRAGTADGLTAEEAAVMRVALQVASDARANSASDMMCEKYLHDWLCNRVEYADPDVVSENYADIPRHHSAIGAILDGSANCQGYADAFCLLATMAGFRASMQCGASNDDGVGHTFNTIEIDGRWYVVDLTSDDFVSDDAYAPPCIYYAFNVGKDLYSTWYSWPDWCEIHPIAAETDQNYFYFTPEDAERHAFGRAFTDLKDAAREIVRQRVEYGRGDMQVMLVGQAASWSQMGEAVLAASREASFGEPFSVCAIDKKLFTLFYVSWKPDAS